MKRKAKSQKPKTPEADEAPDRVCVADQRRRLQKGTEE